MSGIDLADSVIYGHLWATDEARELLGDRGRTRAWLRFLGELAAAQGELGLVPADAAREIVAHAGDELDLEAVGEETRRSGHSMLGLIRVLQRELPADAREWVCHGVTVQDVTDTWGEWYLVGPTGVAMDDDDSDAGVTAEVPREMDPVDPVKTDAPPPAY